MRARREAWSVTPPCPAPARGGAPDLTHDERGSLILWLALFLMLLIAFAALGTEAGRWYLVRAELSKSVDAGALAGAKNISNPNVDPRLLAADFCAENFHSGFLGTPGTGTGTATFNVQLVNGDKITVDGHASAVAILAQVLGFHLVPVSATGAATMKSVEIMLLLDRSGSMDGQPFADLKVASKNFLDYFAESETRDRIGLASFATSVSVDRKLAKNYLAPTKVAIDNLHSGGHTNSEDAFAQVDGPGGLSDQNGTPSDARVQQFVVFFSDGRPNAVRGTFKHDGATIDAVTYCQGNCDPGDVNETEAMLWRPDKEKATTVPALPTGDGLAIGATQCGKATTRWDVLAQRPVPGHAADDCDITDPELGNHVCRLASALALQNAAALKAKGVKIYAIGLGERINSDFLTALATSPEMVFVAPTSGQLQAIFQKVAQDIKLRLVE